MPNPPPEIWHDPSQSFVRRATTPATFVLMLSLVTGYLAQLTLATPDEAWAFYNQAALTAEGFAGGQWWTVLSYAWLHSTADAFPGHLLINLLLLYILGPLVERRAGSVALLAVFLGGVLAGAAGFLAFGRTAAHALIGASGGLYALLGAAGMLYPHLRLFRSLGRGVALWKLVGLVLLIEAVFYITGWFPAFSHESHIAGGLFGIAAGWIARGLMPARIA